MRNLPHYLVPQQRIPGYLPYRNPVSPGNVWVPNASSVDWPQAQFAPEFLPPGSASFQQYVYPDYDEAFGDAYGGCSCAQSNPRVTVDLTQAFLLIGAAALGYATAKYGWDQRIRSVIKSRL